LLPILVGMAGGTASGKTTLAGRVAQRLGGAQCLPIAHDRYYFDVPDPSVHNYDHPDALDSSLLARHLALLKAGETAPLPVYDFASHTRLQEVEPAQPAPVVLVEGILVLAEPALNALFDLRIFVEADESVRLERRVARDMANRGRSRAQVLQQYRTTVAPMHARFVGPSARHADLVVSGEGDLEESLQVVLEAITRLLSLPPQ
jgi:uridine kinase